MNAKVTQQSKNVGQQRRPQGRGVQQPPQIRQISSAAAQRQEAEGAAASISDPKKQAQAQEMAANGASLDEIADLL